MNEEKKPKRGQDKTQTKRSAAFLDRLAASKGKPVRVDTNGDDLALLEALVASGYALNMAGVYRKSMREAHARQAKKNKKALDGV